MKTTPLYLSLGSNMGNRRENLLCAIDLLTSFLCLEPAALSSIIETKSWGFEGGDFLNCAIRYDIPEAGQDPCLYLHSLLHSFQEIERILGRKEKSVLTPEGGHLYHDRPIDIDILYYGEIHIDSPELQIPHPFIQQRPFVTQPLREIWI